MISSEITARHAETQAKGGSRVWAEFLFFLVYSILAAYYLPSAIARFVFLPLVVFAYRSENNSVWIALLLIYLGRPLFLFNAGGANSIGRTPLYPFVSGGITFEELLAIVLIIKSLSRPKTYVVYRNELTLLYLAVVLAVIVSLANDMTVDSLLIGVRRLLMWTFLAILPKLMSSKNDWITLIRLLTPMTMFMLIDQVYVYIYSEPLLSRYISGVELGSEQQIKIAQEGLFAVRVVSGSTVNLFVFIGSLLLLSLPRSVMAVNRLWLYLAVMSCYLQILLSATRGWFISYTVMLLLIFVVTRFKIFHVKLLFVVGVAVFVFLAAVSSVPALSRQYRLATDRLGTLQLMAEGDVTAGGTADRYSAKLPKLIQKLDGNVFGFGFTDRSYSIEDDHVGLLNPIVIFGILGYTLIMLFFISMEFKMFTTFRNMSDHNPFRNTLLTASVPFVGLLLIHITSTQVFGLNISSAKNLMTPVIFSMMNWILVEARSWRGLPPNLKTPVGPL